MTLAWLRKKEQQSDPLTPWQQYQARQQQTPRHDRRQKPKLDVNLPRIQTLRRRKLVKNLVLILLPLLLLLGVFGYFASPLSKVGLVSVQGVTTVPDQQVINATKLSDDDLMLSVAFHKNAIAQRVQKSLPEIKTASLTIKGFNRIIIKTSEYQTVGYVYQKHAYHKILVTGEVLAAGTQTPVTTYPVFSGFTAKELPQMITLLKQFPAAIRRDISEIDASRGDANPNQIALNMNDGYRIIADTRTIAKKIKYYPAIVSQVKQKGVVDLEVGAFWRPYSSSEKSSND
ncbi:cell division protein FtsQ [Lacticaseibacillus rhamnosus K32]|nr:cell division protein FtsQ [Lacticaseibacillus rhamnosus K32]